MRTPAGLELSVQTWMAVIVATARQVSPERPGRRAVRTMMSAVGHPVEEMLSAAMTWVALDVSVHKGSSGTQMSTAKVREMWTMIFCIYLLTNDCYCIYV